VAREPKQISKRRVVWGLNTVAFSWSVGLGAAVPVIPLLAMQLQDNIALAGLVITVGGAGRLVVSYGTGYFLDHFGRRRVAIVGVTIRMIFSFAEGLSPTYMALVGSRFMSGVGTAIWGTGLATITADISTRADRGSITGGRQGFMHLGQIIGPIIGAASWAATGDIRVPFMINGFSKMICLFVFLFVMVETRSLSDDVEDDQPAPVAPASAQEPSPAKPGLLATWGALFASGFILVLIGLFASGLFRAAVGDTIIPVYVRNELGLPQSSLGFILSAIGVGGLAASFAGGRMADRWGVGSVMVPGALIMAVGLAILIAGPGSLGLILLGAVLGAGVTLVHVGTNAFAIDISPRGRRGRFFGQTQAAMHSAALVGPIAVGAIADFLGFSAVFAVLAAFFLFLAPVGVLMARHKISERDPETPVSQPPVS
jgi:MFS transporter, DHA1 family, multidrug resistance protein